jgi:hypothetical protein
MTFDGMAGSDSAAGGAGRLHLDRSNRRPIPPKYYRISEIVDYSGVSRQTIHNYTTMGLIVEAERTAGGHRLYDESVFGRLDMIEGLKQKNKSLREIRVYFSTLDQAV